VKVTNYGTAETDPFVNHKAYLLKAPRINSDILARYVGLTEKWIDVLHTQRRTHGLCTL